MRKYVSVVDLCVIIVVLVLSVIFLAGLNEADGEKIIIELDGEIYASYDMKTIVGSKEIHIKTKYGENKLLIDKNGAEMVYSDCPEKIDIKQGKITKAGQTIVCAPHHLVVYITGESEYDAVAK